MNDTSDQPAATSGRPTRDSRSVGFTDAVMGGCFNNRQGELYPGFPIGPEDEVVDIGTGAGGASLFAARRGASVTFTDITQASVQKVAESARHQMLTQTRGAVANAEKLPLRDALATRVIAMEVLEHVANPGDALKELYRIGQPGALYLIAVPSQVSEEAQAELAHPYYFQTPNHIHIFSESTMRELLSEAGLTLIRINQHHFFWAFWMMIYWAWARQDGKVTDGTAHDVVQPPYPDILNDWATLWHNILSLPSGDTVRQKMDAIFPKSTIYIAQKP
jgi:2-polyprenyl-3-methyl-5-hydroxy-6-metoxy-1,4-benzoquinol methylase